MDLQRVKHDIVNGGYTIFEADLSGHTLAQLKQRCICSQTEFFPAKIGRRENKQEDTTIRGDRILWINASHEVSITYLTFMERFRKSLNQNLFLGLFYFECHYAIYPQGTFYWKLLDSLRGKRNRVLSSVHYLNEGWESADGEELQIFDQSGAYVRGTVLPALGLMVLFLNETVLHRVLPTHQQRYSISGWFRLRGSTPCFT